MSLDCENSERPFQDMSGRNIFAACIASVVLISQAASVNFRGASSGRSDNTNRLAEREEHVTVVKAVPAPRRARAGSEHRRDHLRKSALAQSTLS